MSTYFSGRGPRGPRLFARSRSLRRTLIVLRLGAVLTGVLLVTLASRVMAALSWQTDAAIAVVAALMWAWVFEREQG